jgi:ABC-2 type transport system permease protein
MYHLFKMDLYRMFRSRSLYIILAITAFLSFGLIYMLKIELQANQQQAASTNIAQTTEDYSDSYMGIVITSDTLEQPNPNGDLTNVIHFSSLFDTIFTSKIFLLICGIYTALFVNAERKNGFLKNIAGQFPNRGWLIGSKLASIAISTFMIVVTAFCGILLSGLIHYKGILVFGNFDGLFIAMSIQFFLHYALCLIILLLGTITDSLIPSLMSAILIGNGVSLILFQLMKYVLMKVTGIQELDISRYSLTHQVTTMQSLSSDSIVLWAIVIGSCYAVGAILLSILTIRKRDIC